MNEIARTENGKIYELDPSLGLGPYQLKACTGPIHYKETYNDYELWLDLDETFFEDKGTYYLYPRMPNIIKVFKDFCGYEIQSRSNPDHIAKVELVSINGVDVSKWINDVELKMFINITPTRVGIWKEFQKVRNKDINMCWKITEVGESRRDTHPFYHRKDPDAWDKVDLLDETKEAKPVKIKTSKSSINLNSFYWYEVIPKEAMLVDADFSISASTDDGTITSGGYFPTANFVKVGNDGAPDDIWLRYPNFNVGRRNTILTAYITYKANANKSNTVVNSAIYCEDADNPTYPISEADYDGRSVTAGVTWNSISSWVNGTSYETPSLVTPVQAVINRTGWAYGNAIQFLHKNNLSDTNANRQAFAYDQGGGNAPILTVTWTPHSIVTINSLDRAYIKTIQGATLALVKKINTIYC
jgi:hypothetical protein